MAEKTPLILVPGLLCTEALWEAQVSALADLAEITVTAEHRRHETITGIADAILAAAPPRFALAGLSLGGYIAFEIMRRGGGRVSRLALLDTTARADEPAERKRREDFIRLAEQGKFIGVSDTLARKFIHPNRHGDKALFDRVKAMAAEVGKDDFIRQQRAIMSRQDSRALLKEIACPTMVICGKHDELTPLERSREIAEGIAGAELVAIEFCGHLTTMERPAHTNAALRRWLTA